MSRCSSASRGVAPPSLRNIVAVALAKIGPTEPLSSGARAMTPETPETDVLRLGPSVFTSQTIRENRKSRTVYWP